MFPDRPIQVLRRTWVLRLLVGLIAGPLALAAGWGAVASLAEPQPDLAASAILGAIAAALAGSMWLFFRRESARSICLYEDGVESVVGGRRTPLHWTDVSEIWFEAIRVQAGGLVGAAIGAAITAAAGTKDSRLDSRSTNMTVKLVGRGGEKVLLTSNDKGVVQAFETVLAKVNPGLLAEARRRIHYGDSVRFGPVTLTSGGIARGTKTPVAFVEIENLAIEGGKLRLKKKGAWLHHFSIPIKEVPNVFVLTELHAELASGSTSANGVSVGRNLVRGMYV